MAEVKPMMVEVEALKYHTTDGKAYQVGDTYQVPEAAVENLATQGMAVRVDRVAQAKRATAAPKKAAAKKPRSVAKPRVGKHKS